jgi:hypothetical protein
MAPAHKKALLRSLIRRAILSRSTPETLEVKVVSPEWCLFGAERARDGASWRESPQL